jgi:hypothetical protein
VVEGGLINQRLEGLDSVRALDSLCVVAERGCGDNARCYMRVACDTGMRQRSSCDKWEAAHLHPQNPEPALPHLVSPPSAASVTPR